jgi:cobyrinic acid a,c-diamide synthase
MAGVLFNRVGGPGHIELLRDCVNAYCRARPLGFLPHSEEVALPSRHLGLKMASETLTAERIALLAEWIERNIDLDGLLAAVRQASRPAFSNEQYTEFEISRTGQEACPTSASTRIAVARDAAFCFYYQDNLDLLTEAGAEIVEFSPIADCALPGDIGGIYLGGGYPELHAAKLSANRSMLESIRAFIEARGPVYAECGGFMYLTEAIVDGEGVSHPMVGIFPTRARMQSRLTTLGYIEAQAMDSSLWLRSGERLRGHEFRYSEIDPMPSTVRRGFTLHGSPSGRGEGYIGGSALAGYTHLHFRSALGFAARFVEACASYGLLNELKDASNA